MRIPIVLVAGFLGSGKTTLVNRLFRERPPERGRFAIIVNEFGDVGIDRDLLPAESTRQIELPGGCICCQLVDDLIATIEDLLARQPELGCILIETTGIAEPIPVSWNLQDERIAGRVRLAAIVTTVDPFHHLAWRAEHRTVDIQVDAADILVITKLDELGGEPPAELIAALRERNQVAPIIAQPPDRVAAELWALLDDPDSVRAATPVLAPVGHRPGSSHDIDSIAVSVTGTHDLEELVTALEALPRDVVRLKGIVRAIDRESGSDRPGLFAVHRVGARVSTEPLSAAELATRVVALGRNLDRERLTACFRAAVLPSLS